MTVRPSHEAARARSGGFGEDGARLCLMLATV